MGRYRQNRYAPTKFSNPVEARAPANPTVAVRPEIIAGASATPPEVKILKEAKNCGLEFGGARSAPKTMFMPALAALAKAVTDANTQNENTSVTMNEKR